MSNGEGTGPDQLQFPDGLFIEPKTQILYVADVSGNRVQKRYPNDEIKTAAGQPNGAAGSTSDKLDGPKDVFADENENVFVVDESNQCVIKWPSMYDPKKSAGTVVAGGNGQGLNPYQLNNPTSLYLDEPYNILYISNEEFHSVTQWEMDTYGTKNIIAGIPGRPGNSPAQLCSPQGLTLDKYGNLYITDCQNNRIQMFCPGAVYGITIAGTGQIGNASNQLHFPHGIAFDAEMNLYVTDTYNYRIQKFQRI